MKIKSILILLFCSLLFFNIHLVTDNPNQQDLFSLCPAQGDVSGWQPVDEPQLAEDQDLYLLINGGAEIFYEYGFERTLFQTYQGAQGNTINLEIYQMKNSAAAYGIYTFKTGNEGMSFDAGTEGWLESYYLNFWRGNFLVTVIGLEMDSSSIDGIKKIARAVDTKINAPSHYPPIITLLPEEKLLPNGITYLSGNLALFNQYLFATEDIFGLKDGVVGTYQDYSIFLLQYPDRQKAKARFESAKTALKQTDRFVEFVDQDTVWAMQDLQGKQLYFKYYRNHICIIIADNHPETDTIFNSLSEKIDQQYNSGDKHRNR